MAYSVCCISGYALGGRLRHFACPPCTSHRINSLPPSTPVVESKRHLRALCVSLGQAAFRNDEKKRTSFRGVQPERTPYCMTGLGALPALERPSMRRCARVELQADSTEQVFMRIQAYHSRCVVANQICICPDLPAFSIISHRQGLKIVLCVGYTTNSHGTMK